MKIKYTDIDLKTKEINLDYAIHIEINGIKITQSGDHIKLSVEDEILITPVASNCIKIKQSESSFLTVEHLKNIHPELTREEAGSLMKYAFSQTITYKTCYDKGQIIFPEWRSLNQNKK